MRHVEWWVRYDESGASSRYRAYQYFEPLARRGWRSTVRPLAPFATPTGPRRVLGVARRVRDVALLAGSPATPLVVQKELLVPAALATRSLLRRLAARPLVWDVDDAVWELGRARALQAKRLVEMAAVVVAGSPALAEWCERAGARRVELVPTCTTVPERLPPRIGETLVMAWVGSPFTSPYLEEVGAAVRRALDDVAASRFVALGGRLPTALRSHPRAISLPWSREAEARLLHEAAVGIAPAPRNVFADGKCGFKVVQYAAHGLAVVATDTPTHRFLLREQAVLATTDEEWRAALREMLSDEGRRTEIAMANWRRARAALDVEVGADRWAEVLNSAS